MLDILTRGKRKQGRMAGAWPLLAAAATGMGVMYLFDPDRGRRRRITARDRLSATVRRGGRRLRRLRRHTGAELYGFKQKAAHMRPRDPSTPDDVTLARRVESEVFRDPHVPKGRINLSAEKGVVVLRGELDRPEQITALERATRRVHGVRQVENLLHLTGSPAPNKLAARTATRDAGIPRFAGQRNV